MSIILAIDFDGTCVDHRFPAVGRNVPYAVRWLRRYVKAGARLILWTMRSDGRADGSNTLSDAVAWFAKHKIPLWGVNCNPQQAAWTSSPKVYAHQYIDDAATGCPLKKNWLKSGRPFVNWRILGPMVMKLIHEANKEKLK